MLNYDCVYEGARASVTWLRSNSCDVTHRLKRGSSRTHPVNVLNP